MGANLFNNYGEAVAMILFVIGFGNLMLQSNLIKKIIGLNIMDTAVYLFLAEKGYISGRVAPIVVDGVQSVEAYINPVPSGLVLTGIVVSVSVSALMLSLTIRLYQRYHTLDLDEISLQLKKGGVIKNAGADGICSNGVCAELSLFFYYALHVCGDHQFCF